MLKFICNPKNNNKKDKGYKGENLCIDILVHYNRVYAGKTYTKNTYKKGKLVKRVATYVDSDGKVYQGGTTTYSYKKGRLAKTVYTYTSTFSDGTYTDSTTTLYTYNKAGLLTKRVRTTVEVSPGKTSTSSRTTTIKYKKIKVPKKAKKNIKAFMQDFTDSFLPIQVR